MTTPTRPGAREISRRALGRPTDWWPGPFVAPQLRPKLGWLGPALILISVIGSWPAFSGAIGEGGGSVQYGLWVGAASILLMAWSFVLALRPRTLEPLFGGLDRMYRAHRWAGSLGVIAMFLHTRAEPAVEGGIRGASRSLASDAQDLAGVAEIMLYVLVAISLVRWFPYRYWRWTHKLLGIPFAFASWHFFTAEKTYANGSAWGWWFGGFMVVGLTAYLMRVVGRDMLRPGVRHRISGVSREGATTELRLRPVNRPLGQRLGQFAVLKIQAPGLREPHVFTIASAPATAELRFYVRRLGDWTRKLQTTDLHDVEVLVEGPYGSFKPLPSSPAPVLWIAGGVGITPFLAAAETLPADADEADRPLLLYCVRERRDAVALPRLEAADADGRLRLEVFASGEGRRFDADRLADLAPDLHGAYVAVCGPNGLVAAAAAAARRLGAEEVETELFDIRGGIGPDLSETIEELLSQT